MSPVKIPKWVRELKLRRPEFVRQESWRYVRLKPNWRKPRGKDSKMRLQVKGWPPLVKVGYRTPRKYRGLHPSGYKEVLVYRPEDLEGALTAARDEGRRTIAVVASSRLPSTVGMNSGNTTRP